MLLLGIQSRRLFSTARQIGQGGEGIAYRIDGDERIIAKVFHPQPSTRLIRKLELLATWKPKPAHLAIPIEVVVDPVTQTPIGFVQPFFSKAVPLTRVLDSHGRKAEKLPDDLLFRVKLCRMLAEAFSRIHATNLVIGDVSDSNFLVGRDWLGRIRVISVIDCNSFQVTLRTNRGNEFFPSGVATEEYAAPEVQSTDWATSLRSVYSDSFGFAVLAWKILFGGSHPFAVVTPRSVDVPPIGERIEKRLFPFCPSSPLPANWQAPTVQPSLAVLPVEVREHFFRSFSSDDPRDRALASEWYAGFRAWERLLTPSVPLRILGSWHGSLADRLARTLSALQPYLGRLAVFAALVVFAVLPPFEFSPASHSNAPHRLDSDLPRAKTSRPRAVDLELFPEPIWQPSQIDKE